MLIPMTTLDRKVPIAVKHDIISEVSQHPNGLGSRIVTLIAVPQGFVTYEVLENHRELTDMVNNACAMEGKP